jgi:hypothetical protein
MIVAVRSKIFRRYRMDEKKNLDQKTTEQQDKRLTTAFGAPVADNQNTMTVGPRGPVVMQDVWFLEKMAHFVSNLQILKNCQQISY